MYLVIAIIFIEINNKNLFRQIRSPKQCGCSFHQPNVGLEERIVGGFESAPHSWPWIVSIRMRTSSKPLGFPICGIPTYILNANSLPRSIFLGGTLISERHILTAAHC